MDKEKIKSEVDEVESLAKELVVKGQLDGDQAKQLLFNFAADAIRREISAELTEV